MAQPGSAPALGAGGPGFKSRRPDLEKACKHACFDVLILPDGDQRRGSRPGWDGGYYGFMRRVLETDLGGGLYRRRKTMIEPVFGHTKFNRRADRFQRRGRSAVRSEWRLITATHNLLKLHQAQIAAASA